MFDRISVQRGPTHVSQHVTEQRAPTDESVRLLREMEEAARAKIVESLLLKSNGFEAVVHRSDRFDCLLTVFDVHYSLNGGKRHVRVEVESNTPTSGAVDLLWQRLSEDIAWAILGRTLNSTNLKSRL